MAAISGRKKMQGMLDQNKMSANLGWQKFRQVRAGIKMLLFSGGDKIAGKPAIAAELTGLNNV